MKKTKSISLIFLTLAAGYFIPLQAQTEIPTQATTQTPDQAITTTQAPDQATTTTQPPAPTPLMISDQTRQAFVDKINGFRATLNLPPLQRWVSGEACADQSAQNDSISGVAHQSFGQCQESAQCSCPGYASIDQALNVCLQQMWDEGPGEGIAHMHYRIMSSSTYTMVAVGFAQMPNGKIWVNMNFK